MGQEQELSQEDQQKIFMTSQGSNRKSEARLSESIRGKIEDDELNEANSKMISQNQEEISPLNQASFNNESNLQSDPRTQNSAARIETEGTNNEFYYRNYLSQLEIDLDVAQRCRDQQQLFLSPLNSNMSPPIATALSPPEPGHNKTGDANLFGRNQHQ